MTLLELLVQELPKRGGWPEGVNCISSRADGMIFHDGKIQSYRFSTGCSDGWRPGMEHGYTNAVSKNQYEASIKKPAWMDWNGGNCPVATGIAVDVRYGDGEILCGLPANKVYPGMRDAQAAFWRNEGKTNDIVAYRLHQTNPTGGWSGEGLPPLGCECEFIHHGVDYTMNWIGVIILAYGDEKVFMRHMASKNEFAETKAELEFRPIRTEAERRREEAGLAIYHAINWNAEGELASPSRMEDYRKAYDAIAAGEIPGVKLSD